MDILVPEQIRKVQKLSRYGRGFCRFFYVVMAAATLVFVYSVLFGGSEGLKVNLGPYQIPGNQFLTPGVKAWGLIAVISVFAIVFGGLFHLHGLFSSFIRGRDLHEGERAPHPPARDAVARDGDAPDR